MRIFLWIHTPNIREPKRNGWKFLVCIVDIRMNKQKKTFATDCIPCSHTLTGTHYLHLYLAVFEKLISHKKSLYTQSFQFSSAEYHQKFHNWVWHTVLFHSIIYCNYEHFISFHGILMFIERRYFSLLLYDGFYVAFVRGGLFLFL